MARFFSLIQGQRGPATRLGSKSSGILAEARGWQVGATIEGRADEQDQDEFCIYATGGSHNPWSRELVAIVRLDPVTKKPFVAHNVQEPPSGQSGSSGRGSACALSPDLQG